MGKKPPIVGYPARGQAPEIFAMRLKNWGKELGKPAQPQYKNLFKKKEWISGYRQYFIDILRIDYANSPVEMIQLEEIVRVRNIVQHPAFIGSNTVSFMDDDLETFQKPFLSSEIY